jgi:hypothetical protein
MLIRIPDSYSGSPEFEFRLEDVSLLMFNVIFCTPLFRSLDSAVRYAYDSCFVARASHFKID